MPGLEFHPLTFVDERDGVTVGTADAEHYVRLPADGAELLRRLSGGMPPSLAAAWYHETFGEPVDIADFVDTLRECGLVRAAGERPAAAPPVRLRRLGRAAFSPAAWCCYLAIIAAACFVLATRPQLRPHASELFFVPTLIVVQVVIALLQSATVLWHEWFHLLAARRLGLSSKMNVGRRYYYVVVETRLDGLLGVPPRRRYLPMLAGMLADVLLYAVLVLVAAAFGRRGLPWPGRLALALAYTVLLRLAWQFYLFLRTDLYHVAATALDCANLHEATQAYLRHLLHRPATEGAADWSADAWLPRDRRVAPFYLVLSILGGVAMVATGVFAALPVLIQFGQRVAAGLTGGGRDAAGVWAASGALLLLSIEFVVLPLLAGRGWGSGRRGRDVTTQSEGR